MVEMIISTIYDTILNKVGSVYNDTTTELKLSVTRNTESFDVEYMVYLYDTHTGQTVWHKKANDYTDLLVGGVAAEISMVMAANPAIG